MLKILVGALLTIILTACDTAAEYDSKHVYREVDSPNGDVTARLAKIATGGAAGSLVYKIYLSDSQTEGLNELIFHGYSDCNPEVEWRGSQLLVIRYAGGYCEVIAFHNFWRERELKRTESNVPRVEIMLERIAPSSSDVWRPK